MERERNFLSSLGPIALRSKWLFRIFMEAIARLREGERSLLLRLYVCYREEENKNSIAFWARPP